LLNGFGLSKAREPNCTSADTAGGGRGSRRWSRIGVIFAIGLLFVFFAVPAQAVHKTGAFQLDGDAQQATSPPLSNSTVGDDWDNICASNPTTCTFQSPYTASPSTTATASAHVSDTTVSSTCAGATNCTVFTGGGSKDPQDLSSWNWKTDSGGLPSKDNLAHSFAARYSLPADPATCPSTASTCKVLYFGSDRIDNSGDAQEGFWFFQNPVCLKLDGTFGNKLTGTTCSGTAAHMAGDLLILSDFSVGGTTSTINVYEWVTSGGDVSTNLLSLGGSTSAACNSITPPLPNNDAFCGLVNATDGTIAPWTFTDKSNNNTYLKGEFYEGGVNLSHFNLGGECFASFASESRSSTAPTATLKDFVLGGFGSCTSGIKTTPSVIGSVSIGTTASVSVTDQAIVTVNGATNFGGSVTFHLCGPADLVSQATCVTGGSLVGSAKPVGPPSPATVTSDAAIITSVGSYCWRGDYSGDPGANVPGSSDSSATECFTVTPVQPTLTTQASGPAILGSAISDTATLSGTANEPGSPVINPTTAGGPAGGTISFTAFGPNNCTTVAMAAVTRAVSGDGTYPTATQAAVSFTPTAVGTYTFVASYSGDSPNTLGVAASACPDTTGTETVLVTDTSSVASAQTWVPNDSATASSGSGTTPLNGTLTITLYESTDCTGTAVNGQTYSKTLTNASTSDERTLTTNNSTYIVSGTGTHTVSWLVTFTSTDSNVSSATHHCETTTVTITN